jgi:hypothetical protein
MIHYESYNAIVPQTIQYESNYNPYIRMHRNVLQDNCRSWQIILEVRKKNGSRKKSITNSGRTSQLPKNKPTKSLSTSSSGGIP